MFAHRSIITVSLLTLILIAPVARAQSTTCLQGYVWRAASPADVVCVTPQSRALVAQENSLANSRREAGPRDGVYYCLQGYVWREAYQGDTVCVIPAARDRVTRENGKASARRVGGGKEFNIRGVRTLELGMVNMRSGWDEKTYSSTCGRLDPFPGVMANMIGWGQAEIGWLGDNCFAFVMEKAVQFDRTLLDQVPSKIIKRAILTYDEVEAPNCPLVAGYNYRCWQNGEGAPEKKVNGCAVVRTPTVDWVRNGGAFNGRLPAAEGNRNGIRRVNPRTWDVTSQVSWQLVPNSMPLQAPGSPPAYRGFGLLLSGGPNLGQLTAQDNTVCLSEIQNVALEVTYEVLESGVFRPPH